MSLAHLALATPTENAAHSKRRACKRGHPFTAENTYTPPGSATRVCRACLDLWRLENRDKINAGKRARRAAARLKA